VKEFTRQTCSGRSSTGSDTSKVAARRAAEAEREEREEAAAAAAAAALTNTVANASLLARLVIRYCQALAAAAVIVLAARPQLRSHALLQALALAKQRGGRGLAPGRPCSRQQAGNASLRNLVEQRCRRMPCWSHLAPHGNDTHTQATAPKCSKHALKTAHSPPSTA
jgi:hypothetical protein